MTRRLTLFLAAVFALSAGLSAHAQPAVPAVPMEGGPWIDLPEGAVLNTAPPSIADIHAMADLDGDPSVTTEEEARMIEVLMQVLGTDPAQP